MQYHWNWSVLLQPSMDGAPWWAYLAGGLAWTLGTAGAAWGLAIALGVPIGALRTAPLPWAARSCAAYVELFRNVPLLVQMFIWFFVVPELLPAGWGRTVKEMPPPWASFVPAVVCLGLFTSARIAEQVRAGIQSLRGDQIMAGMAMGLTLPQTYRAVVLPMALRTILPPLTSELMSCIKNTSLALTIGVMELTARAREMQEVTFRVLEAFVGATLLYFLTNMLVVLVVRRMEASLRLPGAAGSSAVAADR
jgi:glutamate/aspartate transport system permease protein